MRIMKKSIISFVVLFTVALSLTPLFNEVADNRQPPTISPFNIHDCEAREE